MLTFKWLWWAGKHSSEEEEEEVRCAHLINRWLKDRDCERQGVRG